MAEGKDFDPTLDSVAVNTARVMGHVLEKGFQLGGSVGTAVAAPLTLFFHRRKGGKEAALPLVAAVVFKSVCVGTALSGLLGAAKLASSEDLKGGVEDRAYRLHYNAGQVRADKFSRVGAAAGAAAAAALLPLSAAVLVGGGGAGAALGLLAHVGSTGKPAE